MFDFLKAKKNTASIAKDRLRIIIAQERTNRAGPDYLPLLQRELLEVIRKYVSVDVDAVKVDVVKDRSEEHTSELQSLMRISYAFFCLKKKRTYITIIMTKL